MLMMMQSLEDALSLQDNLDALCRQYTDNDLILKATKCKCITL